MSDAIFCTHYLIILKKNLIMPRVTVSVSEDDKEYIGEKSGDGAEYDSMSEVMRNCITAHKEQNQLEEEIERLRDRLESREDRIDELESQLRKRSNIEDKIEDLPDKIRDADSYTERRQQKLDQASIAQRLKWKVTGVPVDRDG